MKKHEIKNGFTLIELLAVMVVIAVLAAMMLGISGYATKKSDESKATADIETIKNILEGSRVGNGAYPDSLANEIEKIDKTFYLETDGLKDPWGHEYVYHKQGKYLISVFSAGPDGDEDTTEDNVGQKNSSN